jgi:hypothetical protein
MSTKPLSDAIELLKHQLAAEREKLRELAEAAAGVRQFLSVGVHFGSVEVAREALDGAMLRAGYR